MSTTGWIELLGGGGLVAVILAAVGTAYRAGFHAGQDDQRWTDADRRLLRLERHEGYDKPPN